MRSICPNPYIHAAPSCLIKKSTRTWEENNKRATFQPLPYAKQQDLVFKQLNLKGKKGYDKSTHDVPSGGSQHPSFQLLIVLERTTQTFVPIVHSFLKPTMLFWKGVGFILSFGILNVVHGTGDLESTSGMPNRMLAFFDPAFVYSILWNVLLLDHKLSRCPADITW